MSRNREIINLVLTAENCVVISNKKWDAFLALLDRPAIQHKQLAKLLCEPSALERDPNI